MSERVSTAAAAKAVGSEPRSRIIRNPMALMGDLKKRMMLAVLVATVAVGCSLPYRSS